MAMGRVDFTFNGVETQLRYDINGVSTLEERMGGKSIIDLSQGSPSMRYIRDAIYVGLMHTKQKEFNTPEKIGVIMTKELTDNPERMVEYGQAVSRGLMTAMGYNPDKLEDEDTDNPND
jgi:hypothetical protein